jgi:hypothetical protein
MEPLQIVLIILAVSLFTAYFISKARNKGKTPNKK